MSVTAAQLIARVSVEGAAASEGQLIGLGRASDATQAQFGRLAQLSAGLLVAGLVVAGLLAYLVYALIRPERF